MLVGICAYNEENNIGKLLRNLISEQNLPDNCKIVVVCSGCTDKTPQIVNDFQRIDKRITAIVEKVRKGKANALNKIFGIARRNAGILVLVNADALPKEGSIKKLVLKLLHTNAGAVFARPVPLKEKHQGLCHKIVWVIWRLHHIISILQKPKLSGELCAIHTSYLQDIPEYIATDEPFIELNIRKQGSSIVYVPEAVVYIRCPTNIVDLLEHRKRIWIGHMQLQKTTGFKVSTSSVINIMSAIPTLSLSEIFYAFIGGIIEIIAYFRAKIAFTKGTVPYVWQPIMSTKTLI